MTVIAVAVLHETGIPIYKKFKKRREKPIEPLIAAILGLANEVGLGDIAHASFEKAGLVVLRGIRERKLLLALLVDKVSHQSYIQGIYLLNKVEKNIDSLPDYVTDDIIKRTGGVIERFFDRIDEIPNIFEPAFLYACEKFGPMFYGSLIVMLYKEFGEDPLLTLIREPKKFLKTLDSLIGKEASNQFFLMFLKNICENHSEICEYLQIRSIREFIYDLLEKIRRKSKIEIIVYFREIIERGIDALLHGDDFSG